MLEAPFEVRESSAGETPVIVEVPHAGLWLDAESANWTIAPARSIARDADLYVDELFEGATDHGATLLCARVSRYVVDLNRSEHDFDGSAVVGGGSNDRPRGVIWRLSSDGLPVLRDAVPMAEHERRMSTFYRPYHQALRDLIDRKRAQFGFAVVLCAHSMPSPRRRGRAMPQRIADIVPGTRGRTSAADMWIDAVENIASENGWRVEHDVPYRGGFTTGHYGHPARGVHVVQVEIARRLYMDEDSLARNAEGFAQVTSFANDLVTRTADMAARRAAE
jgi:N-formylglutamate amidohydrolase